MSHPLHRVFNQMTRQCSGNTVTPTSSPPVAKGKGKDVVVDEDEDEDEDDGDEDEMDDDDDDDVSPSSGPWVIFF